jgi:methylated-DNA-[protein]-cysteine S-methyltransferase
MGHERVSEGWALFETSIGRCAIAWTARGIVAVQLPEASDAATAERVAHRVPGARESATPEHVRRAIEEIASHLGGGTRDLASIALDMTGVPSFHARVYEALRAVPLGATVTYGELAARVGSPKATRAIGQAMGKNPFPILVPCHRVVASGGRAGGFSAHGGVVTKAKLLAIEGVRLARAAADAGELPFDARAAVEHLVARDAKLAAIVERVGPLRLRLDGTSSTFAALAESIVYQQLTGKAAATIFERVRALFPRKRVAPEVLLALPESALRGAGLSQSKTLALRDLAAKTLDGTVPPLSRVHAMSDEAIVNRLVAVRGIGRWTVEMLLIFRLGRPDVLPVDDYGVRVGFQHVYRKRALPKPKDVAAWGERWRPYRTVASWYLWRAVDLARKKES